MHHCGNDTPQDFRIPTHEMLPCVFERHPNPNQGASEHHTRSLRHAYIDLYRSRRLVGHPGTPRAAALVRSKGQINPVDAEVDKVTWSRDPSVRIKSSTTSFSSFPNWPRRHTSSIHRVTGVPGRGCCAWLPAQRGTISRRSDRNAIAVIKKNGKYIRNSCTAFGSGAHALVAKRLVFRLYVR